MRRRPSGVIRVRDGEFVGNASNFALTRLSIIGVSPGAVPFDLAKTTGVTHRP